MWGRQNTPLKPGNIINLSNVLNLLKELPISITTTENLKEIITKTVTTFILILLPNNRPLKVSWNTNRIHNKISKLKSLISIIYVDIVLIDKIKLKPSVQLKLRNLHINRTNNSTQPRSIAHDGTAVLVHRKVIHRKIHTDKIMSTTSFKISIGQHLTRISAVYKNSSSPIHTGDLNKIINSCDWFITSDDLNAKHLFWTADILT